MSNKAYPVANYREYSVTRNPYGQKIKDFFQGSKPTLLADADTELHKGKWRTYLGLPEDAFLQLELGAYHGETSNHLARSNPKGGVLGMEWKYKQCFKGGKKARDQGLENVCFLRANMARLPLVVAPGEVDRVWVLFPDPWSKAAHQKWRVLHPGFIRLLASLLKEGKELLIKTDHADYAAFIKESIEVAGGFDYVSAEEAERLWSLIPPTPFERIFIRQGLKINSFALRRNGQEIVLPEEVKNVLPV